MTTERSNNTWMVVVAAFTLLESLVHLFVSGVALLQYTCQLDWLRSTPTALFIRILYFHNPQCGVSVNIGNTVASLPTQALVMMTSEPFTTVRARWFMVVYFGLGAAWFAASMLLIVGAQRRERGTACHCYWSPWLILTGASLFLDFVGAATFISDAWHTDTLSKLVAYIGATASGLGGQQVGGTWAAAVALGGYFGRLGVGWALHLVLFVLIFTYNIRLRGKAEPIDDAERQLETPPPPTGTPPRAAVAAASPPSPRRVRRHSRDELQAAPPAALPLPPPLSSRGRPSSARPVPEDPPPGRVVFPDSLLSLPQRLEQVMAEQQASTRMALGSVAAVSAAAPTSTSAAGAAPKRLVEDETDDAPDTDAARRPSTTLSEMEAGGAASAARGQMPWSYFRSGTSPHRMRDQLPPDEELPPVPVPDYTLRPHRRRLGSLFRGGSSASTNTAVSAAPAQPPPPPLPGAPATSQQPTTSYPTSFAHYFRRRGQSGLANTETQREAIRVN